MGQLSVTPTDANFNSSPTVYFSQQAQLELVQAEEREMLEAKSLPLRNYLMRHVLPTVTQGLIEVCKSKPDDPVDYLVCMYMLLLALDRSVGYQCSGEYCVFPSIQAEYLFKNNPQID